MPQFNTYDLLNSLQKDIDSLLSQVDGLLSIDDATLNKSPADGKWSVAQIIEHLNTYNRYYVSAIRNAIDKNSTVASNSTFRSGFFGNYFTKMMLPGDDDQVKNKMKAAKSHSPVGVLNSREVLEYFIHSEKELSKLLQAARTTNLARIKVPISISKLVRLTLGDTFRFVIAHQLRHFVQIREALKFILHNDKQKVS